MENHQTKKLLVQKEQLTTCAGENLCNHHNGPLKDNIYIFLLGFRFEGYKMKMWCGFISLDQFRFKVRVIEGTQTLNLFSMAGGFFRIKSVLGKPGKTDWIERRCLCLFFIDRIPIICSLRRKVHVSWTYWFAPNGPDHWGQPCTTSKNQTQK